MSTEKLTKNRLSFLTLPNHLNAPFRHRRQTNERVRKQSTLVKESWSQVHGQVSKEGITFLNDKYYNFPPIFLGQHCQKVLPGQPLSRG